MTRTSKLAVIVAGLAVSAAAFTLPAAAGEYSNHWRKHHHHHHAAIDRPLTVRGGAPEPVVAGPDPYNNGPATIVTAPVAAAGTVVGLPFQAVGTVFPSHGDPLANPLVLVGAPVHVAGQFLQFPFYVVDTAFGTPPRYYNY
jgi:hypothetical protein